MSRSAIVIFAVALLISVGLWLSMRAARFADAAMLPASCRRRLGWWQTNATHVQIGCGIVALGAVFVQIGTAVG